MNLFRKKQVEQASQSGRLDDALAEMPKSAPPPAPRYRLKVVTALETINCTWTCTAEEAQSNCETWCKRGLMIHQGGKPARYLPPHQIYEIKVESVEDDS